MEASEQLVNQINTIFKNNVKSKALIGEISNVLVSLCKNDNVDTTVSYINDILTQSIAKKKYQKTSDNDYGKLKAILFLQSVFYDLVGEVDEKVKNIYLDMFGDPVGYYDAFISGISEQSYEEEIAFAIDMSRPVTENVRNLEKFADAAKITINAMYKVIERLLYEKGEFGLMPLFIFHKDVIGNDAEWEETIHRWGLCYYVYNLHHIEKVSKSDLVRRLKENKLFSFLNLTEKDMPNSIHRLGKLLDEAEQLVASAKRGTFPV
jgi:hypothetical protein